jgi:ribosome-associated translation inhibitor RaiA
VLDVELHVDKHVPRDQVDAARVRIAALDRFVDEPLFGARLTLRRGSPHAERPYVADADVRFDGRLVAAHAAGQSAAEAADEVAERLRRQIRRAIQSDVALRNEPRTIERALAELAHERGHRPHARLRPPELRDLIPQPTAYPLPESTLDAVADLIDLDYEFLLFRHESTGEDVVVYRSDDGRIGLLHPPGSPLAGEDGLVVPEPSRYREPIPLERARDEMDVLNHRFLYFVDAADGRGKVIYLRHDGNYGLVEPPP